MNRRAALFVSLSLWLPGCHAEPPPAPPPTARPTAPPSNNKVRTVQLIPRRVLFGNPDKTRPRLSPDGKWLSWLAPERGVLNVWVAPLAQPSHAKAVTHDTGRGIRVAEWAYDNRHIVYARDKGGDENWRLYSVDIDGDSSVDLTPVEGVQARVLHMSPKHPETILVGLNDRDKKWHDVYSLNVTTAKRELVEKNEGYASFVADDDLKLAFAVKPTKDGGSEIFHKEPKKGWVSYAKVSPEDEMTTAPRAVDDSGKYLFMLDSRGHDRAVPIARGNLERQERRARGRPESRRDGVAHRSKDPRAPSRRVGLHTQELAGARPQADGRLHTAGQGVPR